jgi:hypothetical protein
MDCKKCLHYDACLTWAEGFRFGEDDDICSYFTDREEWVHIPVKPFQKVSIARKKSVEVCTVEGIYLTSRGNYMRLRPLIQSYLGNHSTYYKARLSSFGKTVFRSAKEADEALKNKKKQ